MALTGVQVVIAASLACACACGAKKPIDFSRGGSEIEIACKHENAYVALDPTRVRDALARAYPSAVFEAADVVRPELDATLVPHATMVRTTLIDRPDQATQDRVREAFVTKLADRQVLKAVWSGRRLFVRSGQPIAWQEAAKVLTGMDTELLPWTPEEADHYTQPDEGTGEYSAVFKTAGLDHQLQVAVEKGFGLTCQVLRYETVGPQRR